MSEEELITFLEGLTPTDFERLLVRMPGTTGHVPYHAGHFERVAAFIAYVRSATGPGWKKVREVVALFYPVIDAPKSTAAKRVFISFGSQEQDSVLASRLFGQLQAAGYHVFLAGESVERDADWPDRYTVELGTCNYFLVLISEESAHNEMVTAAVGQAKVLRNLRNGQRPIILALRINLSVNASPNEDLTGYLQRTRQREWWSEADTPAVTKDLLSVLSDPQSTAFPMVDSPPPAMPSDTEEAEPSSAPVAPLEIPGGQVRLNSKFYVERPGVDEECYEAINQEGALLRIKAPRQMGKSSLMSRILHRAKEEGALALSISFQLAEKSTFANLDVFLRWFCASVTERLARSAPHLDLPTDLERYWNKPNRTLKDCCFVYFEEGILSSLDQPLAIGLDEVDLIFQYPEVASEFFGMLRAWHEEGKTSDLWTLFRLVLVHSTEVYIPLNIHQSPFNVGLSVELPEFTPDQVADLVKRHGLPLTQKDRFSITDLIGGHPYLVRVALYLLARKKIALATFLETAATDGGPYSDHLGRHLWNLQQHPDLARAMKRVAASDHPVRLTPVEAFQLESMGLVTLNRNETIPRCQLYRLYFKDRLRSD